MGSGLVASGNLCQIEWEDRADDLMMYRHPKSRGTVYPRYHQAEVIMTGGFNSGRLFT